MSDRNPARELADSGTPGPWDVWHTLEDGRLEVYVPNGTMSTDTVMEFKDFLDCEECVRPSAEDIAQIVALHNALPAIADLLVATARDHERVGNLCRLCAVSWPCLPAAARDAVEAALRGDA